MKRVAIGLILVAVLGSVGFTSYKLVSFAKSKSQDKIVSETSETGKSGNSNTITDTEKEGENSNENSSESTSNQAPSSPSSTDYISLEQDQIKEIPEGELDFSTPSAFILSYNSLVEEVGTDVKSERIRSDYYKAAMTISTVGNVEVWSYQHDDSIRIIYIKGKDVSKEVREHINGTAKVFYEEGNTIIDSINID